MIKDPTSIFVALNRG